MRRRLPSLALLAGCGRFGFGDALPDGPHGDASPTFNVAFVTSTSQAAASLGSLAGADALCQARAASAQLSGTYRAWLSDGSTNARDRLGSARGWLRTD